MGSKTDEQVEGQGSWNGSFSRHGNRTNSQDNAVRDAATDMVLKQHICTTPLYMIIHLRNAHSNIAADTLYTRLGVAGCTTRPNANSPHLLVRNDSPLSKIHKENVPR